jgi:hypothetical protein
MAILGFHGEKHRMALALFGGSVGAAAELAMLILLWPNDGLIARARQLIAKCVLLVRARFPCKFASGELGEVPAGYR